MERLVNICDVCTEIFAGGDAPKGRISQKRTEDYSVPIYSNGEENSGLYGFTDIARVSEPSITVSARGTIGYTAIRTEPFVPIVRLITLVPRQDDIDIKYLYYAVQNYKFSGTGTSIPQLTVPMLKQYSFPLPDKGVQQSIVRALDKVSELISLRKQQLAKLDQLVKSRFIELFGDPFNNKKWDTQKLRNISVSISDGSNVDKTYYEDKGDVLFLRIQNVWFNEFRLDDSVYISEDVNNEYLDTSLHHGDLLITKIGRYYTKDSSLGRVSVYLGEDDKANYSNNIMRVRLTDEVCSEFVNILMNLDDYNRYIREVSVGGTDKRALSQAIIGDLPIIMPPKELQFEFLEFVRQTDKSKLAIQQSLDKLETLKKSLMQEYFG